MAPLRGSVVLAGSDAGLRAIESFIEAAGGPGAWVAIVAAEPTVAGIERCRALWRERIPGVSFDVVGAFPEPALDFVALGPLRTATGVWIEPPSSTLPSRHFARAAVAVEIQGVLERGGAVAGEGLAAGWLAREWVSTGDDGSWQIRRGLGILPAGVVVSCGAEPLDDGATLPWLAARPDRVGFHVAPNGFLALRHRRLSGQNSRLLVAPSPRRPLLEIEMEAGKVADLISLSRAAQARSLRPFPGETFGEPKVPSGTLLLGGGGRLQASDLRRFVELAGGPDALILYIPCTSAESLPGIPSFVGAIERAGSRNVKVFHTRSRSRADSDEEFLAPLREAGGLWFGGGRQWNFVDSYLHTEAHRLMMTVLERGGVVGGSSAGASIQGEYMARGDPLGNRNIIAEGYEEGLGFLPGVGIDQHFRQRNREKDLRQLVNTYPGLLGIGIDESTVLWVEGQRATVQGKGQVTFLYRNRDGEEELERVQAGDGEVFDLGSRRLVEQ